MFDPNEDGTTHINIYSKGKMPLGRKMSNFTRAPIEMDGKTFQSVEGYWYWLLSDHPDRDQLCDKYGWQAKQLGRTLRAKDWPEKKDVPEFKKKISEAFIKRVKKDAELRIWITESTLPFVHYYEYGGKVVVPHDSVGICFIWESIRSYLQHANSQS